MIAVVPEARKAGPVAAALDGPESRPPARLRGSVPSEVRRFTWTPTLVRCSLGPLGRTESTLRTSILLDGRSRAYWGSASASRTRDEQSLVARAEISGERSRIAAHLVGRACRHDLTRLHDNDFGAELEDERHVVLYEQDRRSCDFLEPLAEAG